MISIQKISKSADKITFLVKGINYSIANAIRRSAQEIPILAIDEVEFYKNDSALYDEILAHRLGLIPLSFDKGMNLKEECSCKGKGCIKCTVTIKLKAKGPGMVYSKDLKMKGAELVFKDIPIVYLAENQELEFSAEAVLGLGINHAKYSPGLVFYNAYPLIDTKNCPASKEYIDICPRKAIKEEKGKIVIDPLKCDLCNACVEQSGGKIKITPSEEDFIFTIETWGQLPANEIFLEAIKALSKNLKELSNIIKKL